MSRKRHEVGKKAPEKPATRAKISRVAGTTFYYNQFSTPQASVEAALRKKLAKTSGEKAP